MLAVGLKATLNLISEPLVMPPLMPPAPFLTVLTVPSSRVRASLCSDPFIRAAANPSPNSTPRTPGIENNACERRDSAESKNGSPRPAGTPLTVHSTMPPIESPSLEVLSSSPFHFSLSVSPPISTSSALKSIPVIFLAMVPAATTGRVILPEKCPPPRGSLKPFHFTPAT